ncbi:MAG: histidinol-phosphate transaminase [Terriglobia bacterium]
MIRAREAVERLQKYHPPLEGRGGLLRLDFNENTVGCPPGVVRAFRRAIQPEWFARYPEYEEGRQVLAGYFGVSPEEMLLTNGVDDAIKLICDTFVDPGNLMAIPSPTFPIYQFFHDLAGGRTRLIHYDENLQLPVKEFITKAGKRTRWVALANPNNPTGTLIPRHDLKTILEAMPHTLILVDEAYFDFSGLTILPWIRQYPNLIVSRTFSKAFGLAAIRTGFLFTNRRIADLLRRAHAAFAVNAAALACALEAIRHEDYVRRYARMVIRNRERFCRQLESMAIPYAPSASNFVLTRVGPRAHEIAMRLRHEGILVRDWSYDPHLKGYLRMTVGTTAQMKRLTEEIDRLRHLIETRDGSGAWRDLISYSPTGWFA